MTISRTISYADVNVTSPARRMSFTAVFAGSCADPDFGHIFRSLKGYYGPEVFPSSTRLICLIGADAGQWPPSDE